MPCATAPLPEPHPTSMFLRESGLDFDREGRKSTLPELIEMGGLFPLSKIADRLPFPVSTLRGWARRGPFAPCFTQVRTGVGAKAILILVNVRNFSDRFDALAEQALEEDLRQEAELIALLLGKAGQMAV